MKTEKIREAIEDLKHQKGLIDGAIRVLEDLLVTLGDRASEAESSHGATMPLVLHLADNLQSERPSYLEATVRMLKNIGRPLHISEIVRQMTHIRQDANIRRQSVESTLLRHIQAKGTHSKIIKVGRGMYGLRPDEDMPQPRSA